MICPRCRQNLVEVELGALTADVCQRGCGGVWLDAFELSRIDERHELDARGLAALGQSRAQRVDTSPRVNCPRCPDKTVTMRTFFSPAKEAEVDKCPRCGGHWLDHGELGKIHGAFRTDAERKAAIKSFVDQVAKEALEKRKAR